MAKMVVSFSLDTEKDKRLVRWLDSIPKRERSKAIREVLHDHLGKQGLTLADIYQAIQDLKRSGVVVASTPASGSEVDLPSDVLERLGNLGL